MSYRNMSYVREPTDASQILLWVIFLSLDCRSETPNFLSKSQYSSVFRADGQKLMASGYQITVDAKQLLQQNHPN